eukprot:TRINITY_DN1904_c0_g1_i1.p1 TRINITY_DN1904_c0_g1~~TRINITY_DN1904_c0_g1_i1.p1  ORF type:complete len:449 (+),score=106.10 TRINITY_DN1904_c0_g1_i1:85-1431(+)
MAEQPGRRGARYSADELRRLRSAAASQMAPAGLAAVPAAVRQDTVHRVGVVKRKAKVAPPAAAQRNKYDKLDPAERELLLRVQAAMALERERHKLAEAERAVTPGTPPGRSTQSPTRQDTPPQRPSRTPLMTGPPPLLDEPTPSPAAAGAAPPLFAAGGRGASPRAAPVHPPTLDPAMDPEGRDLQPVHWRRKDTAIAAGSALDPGAPSFVPPWTLSWQPAQWEPGQPFYPPGHAHPMAMDPSATPFAPMAMDPTAAPFAPMAMDPTAAPFAPTLAATAQESTERDMPELPLPPVPSGKRSKATEKPKLQYRMRQVLKGLISVGFANCRKLRQLELLPPSGSGIEMSKMRPPDIYAPLSKRSWDQELRLWRNRLHDLDFLTPELWEPEVAHQLTTRQVHQLSDEQIAELVAQYDEERRQSRKSAAKRQPLQPGAGPAAGAAAPAAAES